MKSDTLSVLQHDKARESEAVNRKSTSSSGAGEGTWLLNLPFSGRGMSNTRLSLGEIYNFTMSVYALDPAPGDLVLDLGAGSCWVSEWLNRLLVDTVSLDYAYDMLRIGQQRLEPGAKQTMGDFEHLPFADGTVDGTICLSALHHVPDIPRALGEMHRVLRADGRAVFSEPGIGHSTHPQSQAEMADLGVMERDIVVDDVLETCLRVGFRQVSVQPYPFPPPVYDHNTWRAMAQVNEPGVNIPDHRTVARSVLLRFLSRHPRLARLVARRVFSGDARTFVDPNLGPVWQSFLLLRNSVRIHPLIIAEKGKRIPDSRRPGILRAAIRVTSALAPVRPGDRFTITVDVTNTGDTLWLNRFVERGGFVALGAKLLEADGLAYIYDYGRGYLEAQVAPGASIRAQITLTAPEAAGDYQIKLDMVDESIAWFEHHGSPTVILPLRVDR